MNWVCSWLLNYFKEPNEEVWLEQHRELVSGTETPAVLGLSKWVTPYELFMRKKRGYDKIASNISMQRGQYLEPMVAEIYQKRNDARIYPVGKRLLRSPFYPDSGATPDLLAITKDQKLIVVELKTAANYHGKQRFASGIPDYYILQAQKGAVILRHIVKKYFKMDLPVYWQIAYLIDDMYEQTEPQLVEQDIEAMIIATDKDFMRRVREDDVPDPSSYKDYVAYYDKYIAGKAIQATDEAIKLIGNRIDVQKAMKELQEKKQELEATDEEIKSALIEMMDDAVSIEAGEYTLVTRKANKNGKRSLRFANNNFFKYLEDKENA